MGAFTAEQHAFSASWMMVCRRHLQVHASGQALSWTSGIAVHSKGLQTAPGCCVPSRRHTQAQHVKSALCRLLACGEGLCAAGGWGRFCRTSGGGCRAGGTCSCAAGCDTAAGALRGCSSAGRAHAAPGRHPGVAAILHRHVACNQDLVCLLSQASELHTGNKGRCRSAQAAQSLNHLQFLIIISGR